MGKLASEPPTPQNIAQRAHSGRHYWVRNIPDQTEDDAVVTAVGKGVSQPPNTSATPKKRFVEPYRLSDEQRTALLAPLAERGIGDAESRELFAAALAYDLATCYELAGPEPETPCAPPETEVPAKVRKPAPLDAALVSLAQAAATLADCLDALDPGARDRLLQGLRETDRFQRGYDDAYLTALRGELLRVATGLSATATTPPTAEPAPPAVKKAAAPKPSPAARQFIARAAGAFEECFDQAPNAQVSGPFIAMLKALVAVTGVRIPTDARSLAVLLKQG